MLTPLNGETLYQHLSPLFDAARRRDLGEPDWPFLWLLLEQFPRRLADVDASLYEGYLIGTEVRDIRVQQLLTRLRAAGVPCDQLQRALDWGVTTPAALQWYADVTGCAMPPP